MQQRWMLGWVIAVAVVVFGLTWVRVDRTIVTLMAIAGLGPLWLLRWRGLIGQQGWPLTVLEILVVLQGGHTIEHLAQMYQKYALGWASQDASGLLSPLNAEIVHFVWNWSVAITVAYLLWSGVRNWAGVGLFAWSLAHAGEHTYLFWQYLGTLRTLAANGASWALAQGQPGIFGIGGWASRNDAVSAALFLCQPLGWGLTQTPRLELHFWWNFYEVLLVLLFAGVVWWQRRPTRSLDPIAA